jgi:hypothetical protein
VRALAQLKNNSRSGGALVGLGLMKNIDVKSIIIGALLTSTIFLGVAATSPTDKWDDKQEWDTLSVDFYDYGEDGKKMAGWEVFAVHSIGDGRLRSCLRKRKK